MIVILCLLAGFSIQSASQAQTPAQSTSQQHTTKLRLRKAFASSHDGFSVDEVLIRDDLRNNFLKAVKDEGLLLSPDQTLLALLKLRKTGKLNVQATRRGKSVSPATKVVAEIAIRVVTDRHRVSIDTLLVTETLRDEFQREAKKLKPDCDAYEIRKAALQLRKQRALRPELVLRVADWNREIDTYSMVELTKRLKANEIEHAPGVYLFRHAEQGYLYIGEAIDIAKRLDQHLSGSDRESLAGFIRQHEPESISIELHVFPNDSPAKKVSVRRAYESELIRSRQPKFNVRP